jgi:hypothetical protein
VLQSWLWSFLPGSLSKILPKKGNKLPASELFKLADLGFDVSTNLLLARPLSPSARTRSAEQSKHSDLLEKVIPAFWLRLHPLRKMSAIHKGHNQQGKWPCCLSGTGEPISVPCPYLVSLPLLPVTGLGVHHGACLYACMHIKPQPMESPCAFTRTLATAPAQMQLLLNRFCLCTP